MKNCEICGSHYKGRGKYCSNKCKQKAYRERVTLQDSNISLENNNIDIPNNNYIPISSQTIMPMQTYTPYRNNTIPNIGGSINRQINKHMDYTLSDMVYGDNISLSLSMIAGTGLGYYLVKKYGKKPHWAEILGASVLGALSGRVLYKIGDKIFNKDITLSDIDNNSVTNVTPNVTSNITHVNNLSNIPIRLVNIPYPNFFGNRVNYGFMCMVYGAPGSGKSHFITQVAAELGKTNSVGYVLAEEGITSNVKDRFDKYNSNGDIKLLSSRNINEVISLANSVDYLVIDSMNGLISNYNSQLDLVKSLKLIPNLKGIFIIQQATKEDNFAGKRELEHEVDISLNTIDGVVHTIKNRFIPIKPRFDIFGQIRSNHLKVANFS